MKTDSYELTWFLAGGIRKNISNPMQIVVESDGNGSIVSEPVFSLYAPCKDVDEGIECIRTQLSMLWDAYVKYPESKLSKGGLKLRRKLMESTRDCSSD